MKPFNVEDTFDLRDRGTVLCMDADEDPRVANIGLYEDIQTVYRGGNEQKKYRVVGIEKFHSCIGPPRNNYGILAKPL